MKKLKKLETFKIQLRNVEVDKVTVDKKETFVVDHEGVDKERSKLEKYSLEGTELYKRVSEKEMLPRFLEEKNLETDDFQISITNNKVILKNDENPLDGDFEITEKIFTDIVYALVGSISEKITHKINKLIELVGKKQSEHTPSDVAFTLMNYVGEDISYEEEAARTILAAYNYLTLGRELYLQYEEEEVNLEYSKVNYEGELQKYIPQSKVGYVKSPQFKSILNSVSYSMSKNNTIRNILLKGVAGTGKSSLARELAANLGLPYVIVSCTPDMSAEDMFGRLSPVTPQEKYSIEDIFQNPSKVRNRIGVNNEMPDEVFHNVALKVRELELSNKRLAFKLSNFMKAVRDGGIVEIQEPTIIKNPAVLAGLNSLFEEGIVTIDNNYVFKRHKNCIIVITTNIDYEGCRSLNQSVLDRMDITKTLDMPNDKDIVKMITASTELKDEALITQMLEVIKNIVEVKRAEMITDGEVGLRSLISWANLVSMPHYNVEEAFKDAVLEKSTNDEDDKEMFFGIFQNSSLYGYQSEGESEDDTDDDTPFI